MSDIRLVPVDLRCVFEETTQRSEEFEREFDHISDLEEDPIGQWLKIAKARGETSESDPVLLQLMVELHRKMDRIEQVLNNTVPVHLALGSNGIIEGIGFEHFKLTEELLESGKRYYARITMPVHPRREIPLFFEALSPSLAKIERIHAKDENDWAGYLTSRERQIIRKMKGLD